MNKAREMEVRKYVRAYREQPHYHMKGQRQADAQEDLAALPCRGSYLDVSTGRGEMLRHARALGFAAVFGTEAVGDLVLGHAGMFQALAHELPFSDGLFDVVSLFDVIEHLLPGDDETACRELRRVASRHVLISANNRPSHNERGEDLHVNKRDYAEWDRLFRVWFQPCASVTRLNGPLRYHSVTWRVDL